MPEYLRALVALLVLTVPTLWWLRPRLTAVAIDPIDYRRRATLWVALTAAMFFAHNFWLLLLVACLSIGFTAKRDTNVLGLYCFVVLLVPPFQVELPGFGGINHFLGIDYFRALSALLLLPTVLVCIRDPERARMFKLPADKYVIGYIVLQVAILATVTTATDVARSIVSQALDIFLPYYAFSRALTSIQKLRDAIASFVGVGVVLAVIGVFESLKYWLLYSSLAGVLGVEYSFGNYMNRDGALRASATTGHSIVLGYVLVVALALHFALSNALEKRRDWFLIACVLGAGVLFSFSRGPWIGVISVLFVALILFPRGNVIGTVFTGAVIATPLLLLTPLGAKVLAALPFVGTVDDGTVDYRQQLFTVSWRVLMLHPWLGSPDYLNNGSMEQMRQGEGIIDMVNSYLGVAMYSGFVGLALFVGVFASSAWRIVRDVRRAADKGSEGFLFGRALIAAVAGILVTISTVSSINAVPVIYWFVAGACAAFLHVSSRSADAAAIVQPEFSIGRASKLRQV